MFAPRVRDALDNFAWELTLDFLAEHRAGVEELTGRTHALYQEYVKDHFYDAIMRVGVEEAWAAGFELQQPYDFADCLDQEAGIEALLGDR